MLRHFFDKGDRIVCIRARKQMSDFPLIALNRDFDLSIGYKT
jgi:hypothetical protein